MFATLPSSVSTVFVHAVGRGGTGSRVGGCGVRAAHVDHGKTTLSDSLLQRAGLLSSDKSGTACALDINEQEQERGITIASTSIALPLDLAVDPTVDAESKTGATSRPLLLNLIDSPGHSDFNSEVTAALRLTDGAVVVVDASEGVLAQTETVLRQAIAEGVKPCLFVNKVDRLIAELKLTPEATADTIMRTITSVNNVIATYAPDRADEFSVAFHEGTVGVGSGYYGWGFTMDTLAQTFHSSGTASAEEVRSAFAAQATDAATNKRVRKGIVKYGLQVRCILLLCCAYCCRHSLTLSHTAHLPHHVSGTGRVQGRCG